MTKCYAIWTDVENNKTIKSLIKQIKNCINSHISIINLSENGYKVDIEQSLQRLKENSEVLNQYFPKENQQICDDVWLDYKTYYIEDGTLYEDEISDHELLKKKLLVMKKKINYISTNLPKVKVIKGKDMNGENIEEEVLMEAFSEISINGQLSIVESYYQFKKLINNL